MQVVPFKEIRFFLLAVTFVCALSCKKNDDNNPNSSDVATTITSGNWRITQFLEDNVDETAHFSGYMFTFNPAGTATAVKSGNTVNGYWSAGNDDSKVKLNLEFGNNDPWEELNEDWQVLERNDTKIRLQHVSGGDGSTDFLTFERN